MVVRRVNNIMRLQPHSQSVLYTDGEDYTGGMRVVNVPAGVMTQSVAVAIGDDDNVECSETFIVTLLSVTTTGVTIGNSNRSKVTITDDDSK